MINLEVGKVYKITPSWMINKHYNESWYMFVVAKELKKNRLGEDYTTIIFNCMPHMNDNRVIGYHNLHDCLVEEVS